jgi:hypothetical protein
MRGHRHLVIVVDAEGAERDAVSDHLLAHGIEALAARHGRAALQLLALGIRPCAMLVDVEKPSVAGAELRRALQYDPVGRTIAVGVLPPGRLRLHSGDGEPGLSLATVLASVLRSCPELAAFRRPASHGEPRLPAVRPPSVRGRPTLSAT